MREIINWIWLILFIIFLMGLISFIPFDKYQRAYLDAFYRLHSAPQRRIDATYRYIEAIEDGFEDISAGISTEPPRKYYEDHVSNHKKVDEKPYSKPLYIRDKNNPRILHPYRGR